MHVQETGQMIRKKNHVRKRPPVLRSDADFLSAFENEEKQSRTPKKNVKNKHGVQVLLDDLREHDFNADAKTENFADLLDAHTKNKKTRDQKKQPSPMPLKKRLKRYPPVEKQLDLHGFTAIEAQTKVSSYLTTCKEQGCFTIRIIVGKGLHSDFGPVLPNVVESMLQTLKKENIVLSYEWEKKKKTKSGAVIVFLK